MSRELSLRDVAAGTGMSTSYLSLIEAGRNEPSVGRLLTLVDFYEVDLADILPERSLEQPVVLRAGDRQVLDTGDRRIRTEPLATWHYGEMSTASVRIETGAEMSVTRSLPGPAFVLLLSGELKIDFADETSVVLRDGDSACFEASRRHRCVNVGDREAHVITFKTEPNRRSEGGV